MTEKAKKCAVNTNESGTERTKTKLKLHKIVTGNVKQPRRRKNKKTGVETPIC